MSHLHPFRAGHYDDPSSSDIDGVLDLSGVMLASVGDLAPTDLAQPAVWEAAAHAGTVTLSVMPSLYIVRVGWKDEDGRPWQRSGVIGMTAPSASTLTQPATVVVSDDAFSQLLQPEGIPLFRATSVDGKHFRVWTLTQTGFVETISEAFHRRAPATTAPFVLATADFFTLPAGLLFCLPASFDEHGMS